MRTTEGNCNAAVVGAVMVQVEVTEWKPGVTDVDERAQPSASAQRARIAGVAK
jgi:hypothetical protein